MVSTIVQTIIMHANIVPTHQTLKSEQFILFKALIFRKLSV